MKVLIDIDKEDYRAIKNKKVVGDLTIPYVFDAIRNGTPIPKGHGDLIDRDALRDEIFCNADITDAHTCFNSTDKIIKDAPAIIEADKENESEAK